MKERDEGVANLVDGLWPGTGVPLWQRFLAVVTVAGFILMSGSVIVAFEMDEKNMAERYAGLDHCSETEQTPCVQLIEGSLGPSPGVGDGRSSHFVPADDAVIRDSEAQDSEAMVLSGGGPPGFVIRTNYGEVDDPVSGMLVDNAFVGVEDAQGRRYPASGRVPRTYWWVAGVSLVACVGCGLIVSRFGRTRAAGT